MGGRLRLVAALGVYELRSKPHGLALYRKAIKSARYLGSLP